MLNFNSWNEIINNYNNKSIAKEALFKYNNFSSDTNNKISLEAVAYLYDYNDNVNFNTYIKKDVKEKDKTTLFNDFVHLVFVFSNNSITV